MSLINKELLLDDLGLEGIGKVKGIKWPDDQLRKVINEQRTVEAIPVSWIKDYKNHAQKYDAELAYCVGLMLDDWRFSKWKD